MYFQSVLTDKVHQPLATVRVVPLYQMCGRVAYLCVAFFAPWPILQRFVKSLSILNGFFCMHPVGIKKHAPTIWFKALIGHKKTCYSYLV